MADRIKGITVEIGGDTTGLNKALSGTNKNIRETQSQLKDVERLLKLDPKNTELLAQKQKLLSQAVNETKGKLDTLKQAEKQVQEQFKQGKVSQQQYDGLQREIIDTEQRLEALEKKAKSSNVALNAIGATAAQVSQKTGEIAGKTAPATATITALGIAAFNSASDMNESLNKVGTVFDENADKVKAFAETSLETYGIAEGTALDMSALYGDMATSMGLPTAAAADMATGLTGLAGDLASFKNVGISQVMTALNGVFTGETESLKGLGIVMTQAELDAFALAEGYGKTTAKMTQAEKVQLRYAYVLAQTKNAQGDFSRTSNEAANSQRVMTETAKELSAEFGQQLLPIITPIIQNVTKAMQAFASLDDSQKKFIVTIALLIAAISPVMGIISAITGAISFLTASPMALLMIAIAALVLSVSQNSTFLQEVLTNTWENIKLIFSGVIDFITGVFTGNWELAWQGVSDIFAGIFNGLLELARVPFNGIIAMMNKAINAINTVINGINGIKFNLPTWLGGGSFGGFNIPTIGNIPYLAKGGTVISGSAIVGEAGPELLTVSPAGTKVIPLTSQTVNHGRTGTINIGEIVFNGYTEAQGQQLVRSLNRHLGRLI